MVGAVVKLWRTKYGVAPASIVYPTLAVVRRRISQRAEMKESSYLGSIEPAVVSWLATGVVEVRGCNQNKRIHWVEQSGCYLCGGSVLDAEDSATSKRVYEAHFWNLVQI